MFQVSVITVNPTAAGPAALDLFGTAVVGPPKDDPHPRWGAVPAGVEQFRI